MFPMFLLQAFKDWKIADVGQGDTWFPPQASNHAPHLDATYYFIYWTSVLSLLGIVVWLVLFLLKYHKSKQARAEKTSTHNTPLELAWSVPPLFVSLYMFWLGFEGYMDMRTPPTHAYDVQVGAMKWSWSFTYPNGHSTNELHMEVDRPMQLTMTSADVLHSFYVPAFRTKMDVVPGRYTKTWFVPTKVGNYTALCTEYCGTKHSEMMAKVVVHEPGGFDVWMAEELKYDPETTSPEEWGAKQYQRRGCMPCHSTDGTASTGPTWKGIFGHEVELRDGSRIVVDENYIRESILEPNAKVVSGYEPVMPTFKGKMKEEDIAGIIAYIKSLSE